MRRIAMTLDSAGARSLRASALEAMLAGADEVILAPSKPAELHPITDGNDVADLYAALRGSSARLLLARCQRDAFEHVCRSYRDDDVTVVARVDKGEIVVELTGNANPLSYLLPKLPDERKVWIGQGTNTLKSDLNLAIRYQRTTGRADMAGATLGIPWMAGIPGTVGGWIKMNAGAFGHSISEALEAVCVDGVWHSANECGFAYRHSEIKGEIQDFRLRPLNELKVEGDADYYLHQRRKFPAGTFGSFFKNPPGDSAGRLLEAVGAKSFRVGGAFVWEEHANVIVADSAATASDILALARIMQAHVYAKFALWLEPEVTFPPPVDSL